MAEACVFLASRTEEENHILRKKLKPLQNEFQCSFVSAHPQGLAMSLDPNMVAVVFNFNEWSHKEAQYVKELRKAGFQGHILVMAKAELRSALLDVDVTDQLLVFLEKPFDIKDLLGIVRKMLCARFIAQRIHRRYNTSQEAEVQFFERNERVYSSVRNLSKGGAYIELRSNIPARVGDLLRLKMELKELNRTYTMPAKIVWTSRDSDGQSTAIGVEFVGPADVQRVILGGV